MKQVVKIMADGKSNDIIVDADTHDEAVTKLVNDFKAKNDAGQMMSEEVVIFNEFGVESCKIKNILCE